MSQRDPAHWSQGPATREAQSSGQVLRRAVRGLRPICVPALALAFVLQAASSASALSIVTYNLLNYNSSTARHVYYKAVLNELEPDILVVQEILSQAAVDTFLSGVLNAADGPGGYAAGTFYNGYDTDNAMFYRTAAVTFDAGDPDSWVRLSTALRDIDRWKLTLNGYTAGEAAIYVYTCHLKASQGSDNEAKRLAEATIMRNDANDLPAGTHFVYTGDYNIYYSDEPAYQKLIGSEADNDGRSFDPLDAPGSWHVNFAFADIHCQSPRTTQFGGGANGGLDDRFDQILVSAALDDDQGSSYVAGTYRTYGNDGNHFNIAIIDPPTIPEGAVIADALHLASDHMPVIAEFQVPAMVAASAAIDFGTVIAGAVAVETLSVDNSADLLVFTYADTLDYSLVPSAGFDVAAGPFEAHAGAGANTHDVTMQTATAGPKSGTVTISSDAPDTPSLLVPLSGTVLNHARPSTSAGAEQLQATLDFGAHLPGEFPTLTAEAANFGYDSLQALLEVYDAVIDGPDSGRFYIVGGFAPELVGAAPAEYDVAVDDSGLAAGVTLSATLTLSTRDQQDLPGATELGALTFELLAETSGARPGDLNHDGHVNLSDFSTFSVCYSGQSKIRPGGCPEQAWEEADLDGDGDVDLSDFNTFSVYFGT